MQPFTPDNISWKFSATALATRRVRINCNIESKEVDYADNEIKSQRRLCDVVTNSNWFSLWWNVQQHRKWIAQIWDKENMCWQWWGWSEVMGKNTYSIYRDALLTCKNIKMEKEKRKPKWMDKTLKMNFKVQFPYIIDLLWHTDENSQRENIGLNSYENIVVRWWKLEALS